MGLPKKMAKESAGKGKKKGSRYGDILTGMKHFTCMGAVGGFPRLKYGQGTSKRRSSQTYNFRVPNAAVLRSTYRSEGQRGERTVEKNGGGNEKRSNTS